MKIGKNLLQKAVVMGILDLPDLKLLLCGKLLIVFLKVLDLCSISVKCRL